MIQHSFPIHLARGSIFFPANAGFWHWRLVKLFCYLFWEFLHRRDGSGLKFVLFLVFGLFSTFSSRYVCEMRFTLPPIHLANGPTLVSAFADVTIRRWMTLTRRMGMMLLMILVLLLMLIMMTMMMMATAFANVTRVRAGRGRSGQSWLWTRVEVEGKWKNKKTNYGHPDKQWRVRTNKETMNGHWPYMVIEQWVWTFAENLFDRMC